MLARNEGPRSALTNQSAGRRAYLQTLGAAAVWLSEWLQSCASHYAAARMYERLSHLSDAELECRGLSRATLAQDLIRMRDGESARDCALSSPDGNWRDTAPEAPDASLSNSARRQEGKAMR